jgi:hypothetical protein
MFCNIQKGYRQSFAAITTKYLKTNKKACYKTMKPLQKMCAANRRLDMSELEMIADSQES